MSKDFLVNAMYQAIIDKDGVNNAFEPQKIATLYDRFFEKWYKKQTEDDRTDFENDVIELISLHDRNAFEVGFDTATALLNQATA